MSKDTAFLVDFLPVIHHTVSRSGFLVDHMQYDYDGLKPLDSPTAISWTSSCCAGIRATIRRIWTVHPDSTTYLPVLYRTVSAAADQYLRAARRRHAAARAGPGRRR
ncbi:hypothetical protein [Kribbella sp. NBC_00359]|uniref:hypothetical protein n=1 Tax=Kribbella sp. NBC_00359 TaxID=2975966 RepID=UPI002E1F9EEA